MKCKECHSECCLLHYGLRLFPFFHDCTKFWSTYCASLGAVLRAVCVGFDRLCGLVVRVSGYRYRGPGFDPRRYQIF